MFDEVDAVRFDRVMSNGRTKPILIACERKTLEDVELVAKFSFGCDNSTDGLVREALAAMLAKDLGLPVPEPFLVNVGRPFIDSLADGGVAERLSKSDSFGFGSKRLPDGYSLWSSGGGTLPLELLPVALEIFAFDCFLTNADRRIINPNLQYDGINFAMFDHEYTFMRELNIGWVEPWKAGSQSGIFSATSQHVLFDSLKGKPQLDLSRLIAAFSSISDARINEYRQALPRSWTVNSSAVAAGVTLIAELRDNIELAGQEIQRALA